jgi:hypothetical protein
MPTLAVDVCRIATFFIGEEKRIAGAGDRNRPRKAACSGAMTVWRNVRASGRREEGNIFPKEAFFPFIWGFDLGSLVADTV